MATVRFVSWGVIPLGALAAGALASLTSARTSLWVFCLFNLISPLILWTSSVRRLRELTDYPPNEPNPGLDPGKFEDDHDGVASS